MRLTISILVVLTLAGAYALGRWVATNARGPDVSTLASFRSALEQPETLERSYRFHGFLQTLSAGDVERASEILEVWHPWLVEDELRNFMIAWTGFDAPAALAWALSRPGEFREQAASAAVEGWAFHDPVSARRELASLDARSVPESYEEHLVAGWLQGSRHEGVVEYIASRPTGVLRQRLVNLLTIELMREGSDAVIRWAESIPDDDADYKTMAFQKAGNILAIVDPLRASRWIERHLEHAYASRAPDVIGRRWLEFDPPAALEWLASLPRGAETGAGLRAAFQQWLNEAPQAAEAWVRSSAPAAGFDGVVKTMVNRSRNDPRTALDWALRIHDPPERARIVVRLARTWRRSDADAVEQWLAEAELPESLQNAIRNPPTGSRRDGTARPAGPGR